MDALAERASGDGTGLRSSLAALPVLYDEWIATQRKMCGGLASRRRDTAERLITEMEVARQRIFDGIDILSRNAIARNAFRFMNLAVATAARRRNAGATGDPAIQPAPKWRPFQLAFILLNIAGLSDRKH